MTKIDSLFESRGQRVHDARNPPATIRPSREEADNVFFCRYASGKRRRLLSACCASSLDLEPGSVLQT
jgi:hypothetical protein